MVVIAVVIYFYRGPFVRNLRRDIHKSSHRGRLDVAGGDVDHELGKLCRIAGAFAEVHDRSSLFAARMRSRAIHPASEAASGVEYDSPVLSAQLGSSVRVIT